MKITRKKRQKRIYVKNFEMDESLYIYTFCLHSRCKIGSMRCTNECKEFEKVNFKRKEVFCKIKGNVIK